MKGILSDTERDLVIAFNENVDMKKAVIKVLTHSIYELGVIKKGEDVKEIGTNWILRYTPAFSTDSKGMRPDEIGEKIISVSNGLAQLEAALENLKEYKKVVEPEEKEKENKAK